MRIKIALLTFCVTCLLNWQVQASVITNGDFQNCNFDHWQKDTDGSGDPGSTGDFSIMNNAGECQAKISIDYFNGATAFDANTLFTALDFTTSGDELRLSFDWSFTSFDINNDFSDFFFVSLNDGNGNLFGADGNAGFLISPSGISGAGTFKTALNSSFNNQTNWFLDFTVQAGFNQESYSSMLTIDNVSLTANSTEVPEPKSFAILLLALIALSLQRSRVANKGA
ncbi:hypothetical protein [Thalassotalea sp. SU-HH00458]|uniref:hypothetical protein n=1 Tax=Thalassotalea sp. SU-HH00458 TaxID=3127657 RepID=UPI003105E42F